MPKSTLSFSAMAVLLAITGALASGTSRLVVTEVAVTTSAYFCDFEGYCDQSSTATCVITGTGVVLFRLHGVTCAVAATGRFHH